jgi:hypothetical protein
LRAAHFKGRPDKFLEHRNNIYSIAVSTLQQLKIEGAFDKMQDDFVLQFGVRDFSDHALEIGFVQRLNAESL